MRKRILSSMLLGLVLALGCAAPAMADSRKVVTLGADLTQEQQNTMLRYFGVSSDSVDIIYINNNDEREHLGSYVPLEQIGTKTFSCALVAPTNKGGIQVKTANLSWVTCNMIASTLSTSGVTNCQVVAASPFEVSGTGALTGVIMAYERASQASLDPVKKELANEELVTTGNLADEVGQSKATAVINETKIQVIENNITNVEEITNIINDVSSEYNVEITADQSQEIAEMMQKIAEQEYDITQLKATLERVQANVAGDAGASEAQQAEAEEAAQQAELEAAKQLESEDTSDVIAIEGETEMEQQTESILDNTDLSALEENGAKALEGTTTQTVQEQAAEAGDDATIDLGIPEASNDGTVIEAETQAKPETEAAVLGGQETEPQNIEAQTEADLDEVDLDEFDKMTYDEVKTGLEEAFTNNQVADGDMVVYLTEDAAKKVPEAVEKYLLKVLVKGSDAVDLEEAANPEISQNIVDETKDKAEDKNYEDNDLQQMDKYVRRLVFKDSEKLLADSQLEEADEIVIYNKVMQILEKAFGVENEEPGMLEETFEETEFLPDAEAMDLGDGAEENNEDEFAGFEEETGSF